MLPGVNLDGSIQLPNQWQLRPPGSAIEVGDFPVNMAIHPSGQFLAVLHAGMREHEIIIVALDSKKQKIVSRIAVDQTFYGMCFCRRQETLCERRRIPSRPRIRLRARHSPQSEEDRPGLNEKAIVGGLAIDKDGRNLFAAATWGDAVVRVPLDNPDNKVTIASPAHWTCAKKEDEAERRTA